MAQTASAADTPDQPVGELVDFTPATAPAREALLGRHVTLTPMDPRGDAEALYRLGHPPGGDPRIWTYLFDGPFDTVEAFRASLESLAAPGDARAFTVRVENQPQGVACYLAIVPEHGTVELGSIWFGPALQHTPAATEAIYLLARHAFDDLGFRRVEWKCNALNAPSRRAALRFGFVYEGTFAQHRVIRGRNRDTAWFAITDARWPSIRDGFEAWLDPANFDNHGQQRRSLAHLRDRLGGGEQ